MSDIAGENCSWDFKFFMASQFLDLDPPFENMWASAFVQYDSLKAFTTKHGDTTDLEDACLNLCVIHKSGNPVVWVTSLWRYEEHDVNAINQSQFVTSTQMLQCN